MGLDIRYAIGLMFGLVGGLMLLFGLATGSDTALYERSLGININLIWGSVLLVFGLWMLFLARRGSKQGGGPDDKPSA